MTKKSSKSKSKSKSSGRRKGINVANQPATGEPYGFGYIDAYMRLTEPNKHELLNRYRRVVYSCANLNARAVAQQRLRVYQGVGNHSVKTKRWPTKQVTGEQLKYLRSTESVGSLKQVQKAEEIFELLDHPLLDLLNSVNEYLDGFTLWEMTDLYCEIIGTAFWSFERDSMGVPTKIWVVPSHDMVPFRDLNGKIIFWRYGAGIGKRDYSPEELVIFPFPNLNDPYGEGMSPLRANWDVELLASKLMAYNHATMDNRGQPQTLLTPKDQISADEAKRLEIKYAKKFRKGGNGGLLIGETSMDAKILQFSNKDLEMLAMSGATKVDLANAYDVPISLLETKDVNRANAEAGHYQHGKLAILPRCRRFQGRLNSKVVPMFDDNIFVAFDNPVPEDVERAWKTREIKLKNGYTSINQERQAEGEAAVAWGDKPWMQSQMAQVNDAGNMLNIPPTDTGSTSEKKTQSVVTKSQADIATNVHAILVDFYQGKSSRESVVKYCQELGMADAEIKNGLTIVKKTQSPRLCIEKNGTMVYGWEKQQNKDGHNRQLNDGHDLAQIMRRIFNEQRIAMLASVKTPIRAIVLKAPYDDPDWADLSEWNDIIVERTETAIRMYYELGIDDALQRLSAQQPGNFNVANPRVRDAIRNATMRFAQSTNETTSMELQTAIETLKERMGDQIAAGATALSLTKVVNEIFDKASSGRAERIAKTEASRAIHEGQLLMDLNSGLKMRLKWLKAANACPVCRKIAEEHPDGVIVGDLFAVLNDGPYGQIRHPPAHPECQCTMVEEVIEEPKKA